MIFQTAELLPDVEELIKQDSLGAKSVSLVGAAKYQDLANWYSSADFIISGSHYEGSGTAVCEAMSCGCVPVVTDIASFRMMTGNGQCGLLYEPGNVQDLISALKQTLILEMHEEREKTLTQFREKLSFGAIADRIQRVAIALHAKG
jgi:glycosyltransferase involved in cell wall biosynthesis